MHSLPNNCRVSEMKISPDNWKHKNASVLIPWKCRYRFYDGSGRVKQCFISGVNRIKDAGERRVLLEALVKQEMAMLQAGFNPITGKYSKDQQPDFGLWSDSIRKAMAGLPLAETTRRDMQFRIGQVLDAADKLGYSRLAVDEVKRRHLKTILKFGDPSANSFNKKRAYLMMIYKELAEMDVVEFNYLKDISKQKTTRKIREVLTDKQRQKVDQILRQKHYTFWRYLHIFFHSGARSTELLALKRSDVDMAGQRFKTIVKKGRQNREVWRTIKDIAVPYWEELLQEPGEVLFSHGLKPGSRVLRFDTITKNWWKWVKKPLGITADFYAIKHLHTTEVSELLGEQAAADHNAHTSTAMVKNIYDIDNRARKENKVKSMKNKFA